MGHINTRFNLYASALYGHAYGDAAGAYLEFGGVPTPQDVETAMNLRGGGAFNLAQGQVTDDSELTLQVFRAMYDHYYDTSEKPLDEFLYERFTEWYRSKPFDVGRTTFLAFDNVTSKYEMMDNAKIFNANSESNGALMRCVPHAIFAHFLDMPDHSVYNLVRTDVMLTHPKQTVVNVVYVYTIILLSIFQGLSLDEISERVHATVDDLNDPRLHDIVEHYNNVDKIDVTKHSGWDQHALSLTLHCLFNDLDFRQSMHHVLSLGGDTDTNAAIVGGIIGARTGMGAIPHLDTILHCRPNHSRDAFHPKEYLLKLKRLLV